MRSGTISMPSSWCRVVAGVLAAGLASGASGCRLVGRGGPPEPSTASEAEPSVPTPSGLFDGFLEIEGGRINGTLTLTPSGRNEVEGVFESPPDLVAIGSGRVRGQVFSLDLSYEGACPGRMELSGRWEPVSGEVSGSVRASDCTGVAQGTFLFLRDQRPLRAGEPPRPGTPINR